LRERGRLHLCLYSILLERKNLGKGGVEGEAKTQSTEMKSEQTEPLRLVRKDFSDTFRDEEGDLRLRKKGERLTVRKERRKEEKEGCTQGGRGGKGSDEPMVELCELGKFRKEEGEVYRLPDKEKERGIL